METDVQLRSIFIGASIVVTLAVFSMVMNYYTKVKEDSSKVVNMEIETHYQANIESAIKAAIDNNSYITANQLKNIINYYYGSDTVLINIGWNSSSSITTNYNICYLNKFNNNEPVIDNVNNFYYSAADGTYGTFDVAQYKNFMFNVHPEQEYELSIVNQNGYKVYYFVPTGFPK